MSFETDRDAFARDYQASKDRKISANRAKHAAKTEVSSLAALVAENEKLRRQNASYLKKLQQVKGVAVNMHTLAGRMNSATPRNLLDWSDKIMNVINGKG
jgi:hypothetical protein